MKKHQKRARPQQRSREKTAKQIERARRLKRDAYEARLERERKRLARDQLLRDTHQKMVHGTRAPGEGGPAGRGGVDYGNGGDGGHGRLSISFFR